jgi:hypothetical protein
VVISEIPIEKASSLQGRRYGATFVMAIYTAIFYLVLYIFERVNSARIGMPCEAENRKQGVESSKNYLEIFFSTSEAIFIHDGAKSNSNVNANLKNYGLHCKEEGIGKPSMFFLRNEHTM